MAKKKAVKVVEVPVPFHKQDITHHIVGALAVFGLGLSCLFTTLGVAAVGVNVQVALSNHQSGYSQSAALAVSERVDHRMMGEDASTSEKVPKMPMAAMGSTTVGAMGTSTMGFCPKLVRTIGRGTTDATSTGDVTQLQMFIANHFGLNKDDVVSGHFGSTTQSFMRKFQEEQGLATTSATGPLTRAAILRVCGGDNRGKGDNRGEHAGQMGSTSIQYGHENPGNHTGDTNHGSTTMMGSTTKPMTRGGDDIMHGSSTMPMHGDDKMMPGSSTVPHLEHPKMPPSAATAPVSYSENASNAASAVEAVAEIGDGFAKLTQSYLSVFGF